MVRILVVHPKRLVSSLYASVLDERPNMEVVAQAETVREAMHQVEASRCQIVLVSANLTDNGALTLTREIAHEYPDVKVLVVGLPESKHIILQYVMAGASGYVLEDVAVEGLLDHIEAAQDDKALVSETIAAALMDQVTSLAQVSARPYLEPDAYTELTPRELEILELIDEGMTNREIADKLFIEVGTVKNHVHNILKKLDAASREDAAAHLPFIEHDKDEQSL